MLSSLRCPSLHYFFQVREIENAMHQVETSPTGPFRGAIAVNCQPTDMAMHLRSSDDKGQELETGFFAVRVDIDFKKLE